MNSVDQDRDSKQLPVLALALIGGVLIFCLGSILLHQETGNLLRDRKGEEGILLASLAAGTVMLTAAAGLYKSKITDLLSGPGTISEKLAVYRRILVMHLALCELVAILSVVGFLLYGNHVFFMMAGLALVEMIRKFPSGSRIKELTDSANF
ncbi:MAG TPA: hypothetical protein VFR58_14950 [Flavisolibacter sp.]|nr:hypothetical protein [Flavisolibacter sp.]